MTYPIGHFLVLVAVSSVASWARATPADLVVFPEVLPSAPHGYDAESSPVVRWDKTEHPRQAGVTLISPEKSVAKKPEAVMAYDADGATLLIHVIDDADVMAPATRLGQKRLLTAAIPSMPGVSVSKLKKIEIRPTSGAGKSLEGYLTLREAQDPLLVMIVPDGVTGKDRFVVDFSWLTARDNRAAEMADWLPKAAATIDLAKLQALP